ncbi:unnamed protein product [Calypogeia fissa]
MEKETVAQDLFKGKGMIGGVEGTRGMRYLAQTSGHVTLEQVKLSLMLMAGEKLQELGFEKLLPVLEGGGGGGGSCDYNRRQQRSSRIT